MEGDGTASGTLSESFRLDGGAETVYNPFMELVQIKNLFSELKQKASDLRGFL